MERAIERRITANGNLRSIRKDGKPRLIGHAAVFDTLSEDFGGMRERIAPGAFTRTIKNDDIRALLNHDSNFVLGRNKSGTLRLHEDGQGLAVEVDLPDTQAARDLTVSTERGDISQMSFGFITRNQEWDESGDVMIRTLKEVELFDVSPVTFPAYPTTDVAVRELREFKDRGGTRGSRRSGSVPITILERELEIAEAELESANPERAPLTDDISRPTSYRIRTLSLDEHQLIARRKSSPWWQQRLPISVHPYPWRPGDGGRSQSMFTDDDDCSVRAVATATGQPYGEALAALRRAGRKRHSSFKMAGWLEKVPLVLGHRVRTMPVPGGMTLSRFCRENTRGSFIAAVAQHGAAVLDGCVVDSHQYAEDRLVMDAFEVKENK